MNLLLNLIYSIDPSMEVAISTNGYNLREFINMEHVNKLESIHISRHHYDDEVNYDIFCSRDVASTEDIMVLQEGLDDKRIININTLVMKDYIEERVLKLAEYILATNSTVRQAAKAFCISKSTVHTVRSICVG